MALVNCSECSAKVSDKASTCPQCGYPISAENITTQPNITTQSNIVTTQETGKTLKLNSLLSGLVTAIGVVVMFSGGRTVEGSPLIALVIFIGLAWFTVTRFRIWWHHK